VLIQRAFFVSSNLSRRQKPSLLTAEISKAGGEIAGGARKQLEERLGRSIVTKKNFLQNPEDKKKLD
jgi:hypothetical protein